MTAFVVSPIERPLAGRVKVPGDKSIGHRALLFSLLSKTPVRVVGLGDGADNGRSAKAITALGARLVPEPGALVIHGTGLDGMRAPASPIDCGNSGTTIRLMCGLVAGQPFSTTLFGDESLSQRPMRRVTEPLGKMGVPLSGVGVGADICPPLVVGPTTNRLTAIDYALPVASAQIKSAVLLAALYADGTTTVTEPGPGRDHTERMLRHMGAPLTVDGARVELRTAGWDRNLSTTAITVPGDPSSAAFLLAAGVLGGHITVEGACVNPTRTGFLDVLAAMGAQITVSPTSHAGEPVADLEASTSSLRGTTIAGDLTVRSIDEIPILAILAARAAGETRIRDAQELRVKESDRIATTVAMLRAFGADADPTDDGLVISPNRLRAAHVHAAGDHRIAMAATIAALFADGPSRIDDADNVATSFPSFVDAMRSLGATITVER
jgi:3-phosphoshikimate 1-carboxyvinyltransferase